MTETIDQQVVAPCWALTPIDLGVFLRHVNEIVPEEAVFRLESAGNPAIESFLAGRPGKYPNEPSKASLAFFKTAAIFYMPSTRENLERLADLSDDCAESEFGNAVGIYVNDQLILSWHDLPEDPIYISPVVPESSISTFCRIVDCSYSRELVK